MDAAGSIARIGGDEYLAHERRPFDYMLNALRLREGFALSDFEARTGLARESIAATLETLVGRGLLESREGRVRPSDLGWRFLNDAMEAFLP